MNIDARHQIAAARNRKSTPISSRRTSVSLAASLIVAASGVVGSSPSHAQSAPDWTKGRLLVMPRAGLSDVEFDKIAKTHGGNARRVGKSELRIIDLPANASETAVLAKLAHHPQLKFAELDRRIPADLAVNDPYVGSEWHLPAINATNAWDTSQGAGITIAILDSGVLPTHPDLAPKLVPGWNFYDNNSNTADVFGHGTSVAGAAAAITNNGAGVSGIAGAAKIMPIRVSGQHRVRVLQRYRARRHIRRRQRRSRCQCKLQRRLHQRGGPKRGELLEKQRRLADRLRRQQRR